MDQRTVARKGPEFGGIGYCHALLRLPLDRLDGFLRRREHVFEYTNSPDCVFRTQLTASDHDVLLVDGTRIRPGDLLLDLHWWNEQVPLMPKEGPTITWARRLDRCIRHSFYELAASLASRRELADVRGVRANAGIGTAEQCQRIARVVERYGFEWIVCQEPLEWTTRLHRLGENILISMLVATRNPASLRPDTLNRSRTLLYISRAAFERRYKQPTDRADS